ncbi:hypothetical protein RhiirC2_804102, partial [Rhizophagus irregularis]
EENFQLKEVNIQHLNQQIPPSLYRRNSREGRNSPNNSGSSSSTVINYGESNQGWDAPNNDYDNQSQGWDGQSHNSPSLSLHTPHSSN